MTFCKCDSQYITSLRTKLLKDNDIFDFDEQIDITKLIEDNNLIGDEKQTDVSQIIDNSLEKLNLEPKTPGKQLDLRHLDIKLQKQINDLSTKYTDAFAAAKYDIGLFLGFNAEIPTIAEELSCEKERPIKKHVLEEIDPIMQSLITEGVFAPADLQQGILQ